MAYCTIQDLKDAVSEDTLRQLTDDENLGAIFAGRVDKDIESADTLIDSYLRGKHDIPLPAPSAGVLNRLRQLSIDFTLFFLYKRRRNMELPKDIQDDYDRNVSYLKGVSAGTILLDTPTAVANTAGIFKTNSASISRVFSSDTLKGF